MKSIVLICALASLPGTSSAWAQESTEKTVRVSSGVIAAQRISGPTPVYPADAKAAGVEGAVVLSVEITKTGTVLNPQVLSGPAALRAAASDAVGQWVYEPYLLNGEPVEVSTTVTVKFVLSDEASEETPVAPIISGGTTAGSAGQTAGVGAGAPSAGSQTPARKGLMRVSAGVIAGNIKHKTNPAYPEDAKKAHISGSVVLRAIIAKTGEVEHLDVVSGPQELRESAIAAVQQWKYNPYLLNGQPTEVDTMIVVNYMFSGRP